MNRDQRYMLKGIFDPIRLWLKYRSRVELIRKERRAQMMSEKEAAKAWDLALEESPYAEAYAAARLAGGNPMPAPSAPPEVESGPEAITDSVHDETDETETQNLKQSAQANHAWVAAMLHKRGVKRKDAPNDAAYNLYTWVRADAKNMDEFMKSQIKLGTAKEGASSEKMGEDGREALDYVDRILDKEYETK